MAKSGFMLSRLVVTGDSKMPAAIPFAPGLNVIGGPSDTGKTYIFDAINFVFGAKAPPEVVPESAGYDTINVELKTGKQFFTLRRRLDDSRISVFQCSIDSITDDTHVEILSTKHSADKDDNVSAFLLKLAGISKSVPIPMNKDGETSSLSFRNLWHFVAVDEMEILTKGSPVTTEQYTQKTTFRGIFDYLLTGKTTEKKPKVSVKTQVAGAKQEGQLELFGQMIADLETQIALLDQERARFGNVQAADMQISQLTEQLALKGEKIASFMERRNKLIDELESLRSRASSISNMRRRFDLLHQHYTSDLSRLDFISQGHILLAQLQTSTCPTCGHELDDGAHSHSDAAELDVSVQESCKQEAIKIRNHLADLENTFDRLAKEFEQLNQRSAELRSGLDTMEHDLQNELKPGWVTDKRELESLVTYQRVEGEYQATINRLSTLRVAHAELRKSVSEEEELTEQVVPEVIETIEQESNTLPGLTAEVHKLLKAWQFSDQPVSFDPIVADLIIGEKARRAFGKGKRAVLYSSFLISLLNYCSQYKKPHPGFVILDSPLTTHVQDSQAEEEDDEVSEEIQEAFFSSLATTPADRQVIILDNKLPASTLKINFIHFMGPGHKGRAGFFPE